MRRRIDVVVPARDEADRIGACLDALVAARARLRRTHPDVVVDVTVVLDHCTDDTEARIRSHDDGRHVRVHESTTPGVGPARDLGIRAALALPGPATSAWWIANTDADSVVAPDWLGQQADAMAADDHVLVGAVVPSADDLDAAAFERWRRTHPPGATLGHVHGANLGVRADVYLAVGGFAPVVEHEDVLLVARARDLGYRIAATEHSPVTTSGRFVGRTPGGYAAHLRDRYGDPTPADIATS